MYPMSIVLDTILSQVIPRKYRTDNSNNKFSIISLIVAGHTAKFIRMKILFVLVTMLEFLIDRLGSRRVSKRKDQFEPN